MCPAWRERWLARLHERIEARLGEPTRVARITFRAWV
jgi:hypothetical protein